MMMRKLKGLTIALVACLAGSVLLSGCLKDKCLRTQTYTRYDPVYLTADSMRLDIAVSGPRDLVQPGNLYYYNGYILINEVLQGIHIIDNRDPANPVNTAFIEIPGNRDIAVRNNVLYADMFIDLVSIDISDVMHPVLLCRNENVFQSFFPFDETMGYVVQYTPTSVTEEIDCSSEFWDTWWFRRSDQLWVSNQVEFDANVPVSGQSSDGTGIAGSMARFSLAKGHLYTLDQASMHVFNLDGACPQQGNTVDMAWGIETLFPYQDYLFVGSTSGMFIYDNTNPSTPSFLSQFAHAQACDPVFVSEDIAYVTLRDGTPCQNFINQLDVIDVSTISEPKLIQSFQMQHPHGLSVTDHTLYLCEGQFGLKVFDATENAHVGEKLLAQISGIEAFDVIVLPQSEVAMVIGSKGLFQYDVSDPNKPVQLSSIPINR